ncbi:hypothetical protein CYMTET_46940 [Cymbomonas tetramitiformis]|uniref:NAD(P)-binding protein n=1 Tax=Cymbomonas tetramitiformis TaxID=36881 RepID=A0AAE0BWZ6_9CHLO|nr:hypothetical protein CYMTET_46940 [Cymbomonas tetramitiformis]
MGGERILVTGGNSGIGLALCKQLATEHDCHVYLGSRSMESGSKALESIFSYAPQCNGKIELVNIDVMSDASVTEAANSLRTALGSEVLYAVVNNAGTGLAHGVAPEVILDTNLYGVKRVCEAFLPLLHPVEGRIVNVGSGAGPMWLNKQSEETKGIINDANVTWQQIDGVVKAEFSRGAGVNAYGVSKSCVSAYTALLARTNPNLKCSSISPGFIDTAIVRGFGAKKSPEEGTVSIRHCLFARLEGNGWYYGSDAVRSPLDVLRNPGEPPYTGK